MSSITIDDLKELLNAAKCFLNARLAADPDEIDRDEDALIRVMRRCLQRRDDLPDDELDRYLNAVLQAAGSGLRHYTMQKSLDDMRAAMRAAMLPVPLFDSQCRELCAALGWQGGTYHQVLAEVKRLKSDDAPEEAVCARAKEVVRAGLSSAAVDVLTERRRQISAEGWTPEHDDNHPDGALSMAAACYAAHAGTTLQSQEYSAAEVFVRVYWPWAMDWWKPTAPRRDLVKAGALTLAQIERLDRAAQKGGE
jgi:hypothetical protein